MTSEKWFSLEEWERSLIILLYKITIPNVLDMELKDIYSKLIDNQIILENYYEFLNLSFEYDELYSGYSDETYRGHQSDQIVKFNELLESGATIGVFKEIFRKSRFKTNMKDKHREPELKQTGQKEDYDESQLRHMINERGEAVIRDDLLDFINKAKSKNYKQIFKQIEKFSFIKIVVFTKPLADGEFSYYTFEIDEKNGNISIHDTRDNSVIDIDPAVFFQPPVTMTCHNFRYKYDGNILEPLGQDFKKNVGTYIMFKSKDTSLIIEDDQGEEVDLIPGNSFKIVGVIERTDGKRARYKVVKTDDETSFFYIDYNHVDNDKLFTEKKYEDEKEYKLSMDGNSRTLFKSDFLPMMISDITGDKHEELKSFMDDDGRLGLSYTNFKGSPNKLVFKSLRLNNKDLYSVFDLKNGGEIIIQDVYIKVEVVDDIIPCSPQAGQAGQAGQDEPEPAPEEAPEEAPEVELQITPESNFDVQSLLREIQLMKGKIDNPRSKQELDLAQLLVLIETTLTHYRDSNSDDRDYEELITTMRDILDQSENVNLKSLLSGYVFTRSD